MKRRAMFITNAALGLALTLSLSYSCFAESANSQSTNTQTPYIDKVVGVDIDAISKENSVDPNELRAVIQEQMNEPVFSPFSSVNSINSVNAMKPLEEQVMSTMAANGKVTRSNQDSTAYLATGNKTASGVDPYVGSVAVHHNSKGTPYIPFGTNITLSNSVSIGGSSYSSFTVEDTGDPKFTRSSYWIDIFFGANNKTNYKAAINYGVKSVTYSYSAR